MKMSLFETEKVIIANRGNKTRIEEIMTEIDNRMKEIDYIMERFLEEYPESVDPKVIKFEVSHNREYSDLARLKRIANAYIS